MLLRFDSYACEDNRDGFVDNILATFRKFTELGSYKCIDDGMKYVIVKGYNGAYDEATRPVSGRDLDTRLRPILEYWIDSILEEIGTSILAPVSIVWDGESFSIGYKIDDGELKSRAKILIVPSHEAYAISKAAEKEEAVHE